MSKTAIFVLALVVAALVVQCAEVCAATRTTPVEVNNAPTVKIDPTANTVKAEQNGPWNVELSASANTVKVDPAQNTVKSEQSGQWAVAIQGTPSVSVEPSYRKVTLFPDGNRILSAGQSYDSALIDCRGFKELRVIVHWEATSAPRIGVSYQGLVGFSDLGYYMGNVNNLVTDPSFTYGSRGIVPGTRAALSFPVVSDYMKVWVQATVSTTVWSSYCFAYLVN
ncbi:MAG: hypothetical protein QHI38_04210 [Armatimonadota bacterium]|nr:hypothetical protein [Armatimonadota bacterium]